MQSDSERTGDHEIAYRAFKVDAGGRICGVDIVTAGSDTEAVTLAATLPRHHGRELWEQGRFIARLPAGGPIGDAA